MQTFLPYASFADSGGVLDPKRLGKQRVEALQIIKALTVPGYGWRNHPAVLMWKGHEEALVRYGLDICTAWCSLGFDDTCEVKMRDDLRSATGLDVVRTQDELGAAGALPAWLGDEALHVSHRSALVRKDPDWYGPLFPGVPDDIPYLWPVRSQSALDAEARKRAREEAKAAGAPPRRARRGEPEATRGEGHPPPASAQPRRSSSAAAKPASRGGP